MYSYVHLGPPLIYMLSKMKIPIIQGNTVVNLLDYMSILKQGFTNYNIIENIIEDYANLHGIHAEPLFNEAFGGHISATYVPTNVSKISMAIASDLNTYDLIKYLDEEDDVLSYNVISSPTVNHYIKTHQLQNKIKKEQQLEQVLSILLFSGKYEGFIPLEDYVKAIDHPDTIQILLNDDRINLYVAIILNDILKVKLLLLSFDPRFDQHESYKLALKYGNKNIIDMITENIISRNWYDQQVFYSNFDNSTVKDDLYHYYKNM